MGPRAARGSRDVARRRPEPPDGVQEALF
jgi:hypothetical protein